MSKISIRFFDDREVRAVWDDELSKWYFCVVDIVAILNQQDDYKKAGNYWRWLKKKLKSEGSQFVSDTHKLRVHASDGKKYLTDTLDSDGITSLAKHFPNTKASKFLDWFLYSDSSVDGQSKKKAYAFFGSNLVGKEDAGKVKSLRQIHAYLFGGLYDFAGKIRNKNIAKGSLQFAMVQYLEDTLSKIENMPDGTFDEILDKYVEMNIAHPFMEGNGRSTRIWLDMLLKERLSMCVDWSKISKSEYLNAIVKSPVDSCPIKKIIKSALTDKINDREVFMKGIDYSYYYEEN